MEKSLGIQIEKLPEGVYLATSEDLQGLVAQGRTVTETLEIARDVARNRHPRSIYLITITMHIDLPEIIKSIGYVGVWFIIFAESGLLVGFFLPGDSLLFTAGFLASQPQLGIFNIWVLVFGAFVCAVLGDNVGYGTGHRFGRKLFNRGDSRFFHKKHLVKTQDFYEKHGKKTIILARFMPIVRTFAPIVAGIGAMHYQTFVTYNLIGGFLWTFGLTLAGYYLGRIIPDVDKYLLPIIAVIVIISFLPSVIHLIQENRKEPRE